MPVPRAVYIQVFGHRIPLPYISPETRLRVIFGIVGPVAGAWAINVIPMPAILRAILMIALAVILFRSVRRLTNDLNQYIKNAKEK